MKKILLSLAIGIPLIFGLTALFIYLSLPDVTDLKTKNPKTTALIGQRFESAQKATKNIVIRQQWVSFKRIPKLFKDAIRISEDGRFYEHQGADLTEIKAAIKKNWEKGKYVRGASTITQQLAKNLYLSPEKSLIRKIKEFLIARRLETHLGKNRIFHLYLNVIELGPGIYGVQAASQYFFHKDVSRLNLEEMVRLAAIIPRPLIENPTRNSHWLKWKAGWILDMLRKNNYITEKEYRSVREIFR